MPLPLAIPAAWGLSKVPRFVWAGLAIVAVLGLLWGSLAAYGGARYRAGVKDGRAAYERQFMAAYDKSVKQAMKREAQAGRISAKHRDRLVQANTATRATFNTLREKVPSHVGAKENAGCVVPVGFVELYNQASAGGGKAKVPRPAGGPVGAPSGVQLSDVLYADLDNLELGHLFRNEASTWRAWYVEQRDSWNAQPP